MQPLDPKVPLYEQMQKLPPGTVLWSNGKQTIPSPQKPGQGWFKLATGTKA